ncbi:MAG TPA: hypothetical protein DCF45_06535 [Gammaproteobacteria bacterium]|nr:hypothetical protein [Gammaproteobacteria bacterium]
MSARHDPEDLIRLFNTLFERQYRCRLVRGGDEPLYLPAVASSDFHLLQFAHGYFASALHEVAHWCIAGPQRRLQVDFGYWYRPQRNQQQQREFERLEVKPQALESLFAEAAGFPFQVSIDNFAVQESEHRIRFAQQVAVTRQQWVERGLPARAQLFRDTLYRFYRK